MVKFLKYFDLFGVILILKLLNLNFYHLTFIQATKTYKVKAYKVFVWFLFFEKKTAKIITKYIFTLFM